MMHETVNTGSAPLQILVVDDEPDTGALFAELARHLRRPHWRFAVVTSGAEALLWLADNPCDVCLLDLLMPGLSGFETLDVIRREHPAVTVIMLSGLGDRVNLRKAMNRGAFDFLEKPVSLDDLIQTISKAEEGITQRRSVIVEIKRAQQALELAYHLTAHTDSVVAAVRKRQTDRVDGTTAEVA